MPVWHFDQQVLFNQQRGYVLNLYTRCILSQSQYASYPPYTRLYLQLNRIAPLYIPVQNIPVIAEENHFYFLCFRISLPEQFRKADSCDGMTSCFFAFSFKYSGILSTRWVRVALNVVTKFSKHHRQKRQSGMNQDDNEFNTIIKAQTSQTL